MNDRIFCGLIFFYFVIIYCLRQHACVERAISGIVAACLLIGWLIAMTGVMFEIATFQMESQSGWIHTWRWSSLFNTEIRMNTGILWSSIVFTMWKLRQYWRWNGAIKLSFTYSRFLDRLQFWIPVLPVCVVRLQCSGLNPYLRPDHIEQRHQYQWYRT